MRGDRGPDGAASRRHGTSGCAGAGRAMHVCGVPSGGWSGGGGDLEVRAALSKPA
jgi:hypothetical protein